MKKINYLVCSIIGLSLLMFGCGNKSSLAKEVPGTYQITETQQTMASMDEPGLVVSMNYTQEFKTDDRFVLSGTLKMVVMLEDSTYYNVLGFEYAIEAKGGWEVKGDSLYQRIDPKDVNIVLVDAVASEEDELSNYILGTIQESVEVYLPQMKESLNSSSKIVKIDATEMVLNSQGNDMIYKRVQ